MKIRAIYSNGKKETFSDVKDFGIVGTRMNKEGNLLHDIAIRFMDEDMVTVKNVLRLVESR